MNTVARRRAAGSAGLAGILAVALLGGCAALNTVRSAVSTYGDWPAGRAPGRYAFDRLPSQQQQPDNSDRLEAAAAPALDKAGFVRADPGQAPDVLVQLAARSTRAESAAWADPLWWPGGHGVYRRPWVGPGWAYFGAYGAVMEMPRYDREVAVLIRDAGSGRPLYEARAENEGASGADIGVVGAMFQAALYDFPRTGPNPRPVAITLP